MRNKKFNFLEFDYGKSRKLFEEFQLAEDEIKRLRALPKKKIKAKKREMMIEDLLNLENYLIIEMARARGLLFFSRS